MNTQTADERRRPYTRTLRPEVFPKSHDPSLRKLAWMMDSSIRFGRWSFGVDGIIGLVPGIGDLCAGLVSAYIIFRAAQAGVPRVALARMMVNTGIDTLLGAVPIFGDLFDIAFKANLRNVKIYEETLAGRRSTAADWGFFTLLALGLAAILAVPIAATVLLVKALFGW